ncbi:MAG: acyltransferase family protein [Rhodospirillaceae bacterium]
MIRNVQALRAFAALWVAWYHTMQPILTGAYGLKTTGTPLFHGAGEIGWIGVDVFFVISGFIMTYCTRELGGGKADACEFMWKRVKRVVPLYWLLTSIVVAAAIALPHFFNSYRFELVHAIKSYLFLPAARPDGTALPPLVPGWTLNYEMYFYFVFGLMLWVGMHRSLGAFVLVFAGSVALGQLLQHGAPWPTSSLGFLITSPLLLEFFAGVVIARAVQHLRVPAWAPVAMMAGGALLLRYWFMDIPRDEEAPRHVVELYRVLVLGVPAALLVTGAVLLESRWTFPRPVLHLGDASYSIYLTHFFVPGLCAKLFVWMGLAHVNANLFVGVCLMLIVMVGLFFYHYVESPMLKAWKRTRPAAVRTRPAVKISLP